MPYEPGKRSVNLGTLQARYLNNGIARMARNFQLPNNLPPPGPNVAPFKQGASRRVFTRRQVMSMSQIVNEHNEGELDFDPANPYGASDTINGAEFVFHGSKVTWDAIYERGGLMSVGMNPRIDQHVHSSTQAESAYISGTRALSVAQSFASKSLRPTHGEYGFIYLFHIEGGIVIGPGHGHNQAEIVGLGQVPIRDILMFKWLAQPRKIYINQEYEATPLTGPTINQGLNLIGDGATP